MSKPERTLRIEPENGPRLDAVYLPGEAGAAVVAPPHPEYGGRMDNPIVTEIVRGLGGAGFGSLRFDWRGVGRSEGTATGDADAAGDDYRAALAHLATLHSGPFLGAGYSFGAAAALGVAARDPRLERLVLVSPPVGMYAADFGAANADVLVIVGDDDQYAPLSRLEALIAPHARVRLDVLDGHDHFFSSGSADLAPRIAAFLGS